MGGQAEVKEICRHAAHSPFACSIEHFDSEKNKQLLSLPLSHPLWVIGTMTPLKLLYLFWCDFRPRLKRVASHCAPQHPWLERGRRMNAVSGVALTLDSACLFATMAPGF